jgi:hypothetical protein
MVPLTVVGLSDRRIRMTPRYREFTEQAQAALGEPADSKFELPEAA